MVGAQRFHSRCAVHLLSFMMQSETVDANKTEKNSDWFIIPRNVMIVK